MRELLSDNGNDEFVVDLIEQEEVEEQELGHITDKIKERYNKKILNKLSKLSIWWDRNLGRAKTRKFILLIKKQKNFTKLCVFRRRNIKINRR